MTSPVSQNECSFCHVSLKKPLACGQCRVTFYCGVTCQKAAWKLHKPVCVPFQNSTAEATACAVRPVFSHRDDGKTRVVSEKSYDPEVLGQEWIDLLEPVSSRKLQKARDSVVRQFASLVAARRKTMAHPDDPAQWGGFFYQSEVSPCYKPGRVPQELQALYETPFVREAHGEDFLLLKRHQKFGGKGIGEFVKIIQNGHPAITDCGSIASFLLLSLYDRVYPEDAILSDFIGYPPKDMSYVVQSMTTVSQKKKGVESGSAEFYKNRPLQLKWEILLAELSRQDLSSQQIELRPFDLCYLRNDLRYKDYPESSLENAFSSPTFQGAGNGWWLLYLGKNKAGEELYVGFGEDSGPLTLKGWRSVLRQAFFNKWGAVPADYKIKTTYYLSPFREIF